MNSDIELVGKIGSMALIRKDEHDIDYNVSADRSELHPGMNGSLRAVEYCRLSYIKKSRQRALRHKKRHYDDYSHRGRRYSWRSTAVHTCKIFRVSFLLSTLISQ